MGRKLVRVVRTSISFYCVRFTSCVVEGDGVEASLVAADGGAARAVAVLAELAESLVDGVEAAEAAEAVSRLGLGDDGVELGAGCGLVGVGVLAATAACGATAALATGGGGAGAGVLAERLGALFTVVLATFFDGVLDGLAGCAGCCEAPGAFATVLPAFATIAGPSLAFVAVPASAGGVSDAVGAACAVVAGWGVATVLSLRA